MLTKEALRVEHLRKTYRGREVLRDVTFRLEPGEAAALLGPRGAGKTTLCRILAGMTFPEGGSVSLFGSAGEAELHKARGQVGFLVDVPFANKSMNVEKNLHLRAGLYGKPDKDDIRRLMKRLKISEADVGGKRISLLRKATQALYALAGALVNGPGLLILDEPLTDLDTEDLEPVYALLRELREAGTAMLLSGESADRLRPICSRVFMLNEGVLTGPAPMEELAPASCAENGVDFE